MSPRHLGNPGAHVAVRLDEAFHGRLACPVHFGPGQGLKGDNYKSQLIL